jgi:hypothetical protein
MVIAGDLAIDSDFEALSEPPRAEGLYLECYPIGSTANGSPIPTYGNLLAPPPPAPAMSDGFNGGVIVVTGMRAKRSNFEAASALSAISEEAMAGEEQLGDLKLYRVPRPVTVASKGMKQIAFLSRDAVRTRWVYYADCDLRDRWYGFDDEDDLDETTIRLFTENKEEFGLGASLPLGTLNAFEPTAAGPQLVAEIELRDYPVGQEVDLELGESARVFAACGYTGDDDPGERGRRWSRINVGLWNANDAPAQVRLALGYPGEWDIRSWGPEVYLKNGELVMDVEVPANGRLQKTLRVRNGKADPDDN